MILAGGASRRFGSDKPLALLAGVSLLDRVAARARVQVGALAVSGHAAAGRDFAVIADREPGQGPLAAVCGCLEWAGSKGFPLVATFACDAPFFPLDLVAQLGRTLAASDCVLARSGGREHYAFGLWRTACGTKLVQALAAGVRSFRDVGPFVDRTFCEVPSSEGPQGDAFFNINRPEDLAVAQTYLSRSGAIPAGP